MGEMCSKLFCLLCCPPYLPTIVSKLAFNTPPSSYSVIREADFTYKLKINNDQYQLKSEHEPFISIYVVQTRSLHEIPCMYIKSAPWTKTTILFSHGNAVDLGMIASRLIDLSLNLRVNVLAYDYSGYGASTGHSSEQTLYENIEAVLELADRHLGVSYTHLVLYGQSIGSVPTIFLATKYEFGVVVLHAPLASGFRFLRGCWSPVSRCCDVLDNVGKIGQVQCPVLLIHGVEDEVTFIEHSFTLLKSVPSKYVLEPLFIEGAGHNNCELFPEYVSRLRHLIDNELTFFQTSFSDSLYRVK